jgi:hypothetical protein
MSNVNTARKSIVSAKDLALAVVMHGAKGVRDLHNSKGFAVKTLDGAIDVVGADSEHGATLADLRNTLFPASTGTRGRKGATVGESRDYSVQEVGETGAFVRLPVGLLGLCKGDTVTVTFEDNRIVVSRKGE